MCKLLILLSSCLKLPKLSCELRSDRKFYKVGITSYRVARIACMHVVSIMISTVLRTRNNMIHRSHVRDILHSLARFNEFLIAIKTCRRLEKQLQTDDFSCCQSATTALILIPQARQIAHNHSPFDRVILSKPADMSTVKLIVLKICSKFYTTCNRSGSQPPSANAEFRVSLTVCYLSLPGLRPTNSCR